MLKKYTPVFICVLLGLIFLFSSINSSTAKHINTYPNLPAPIGEERILITSAGQAVEGTIILTIAENLNLEADYRPRALGTDLYDYKSVIIVLGYSSNGLSHVNRSFQEELIRTKEIVEEAKLNNLPVILINLSGPFREEERTWELFTYTVGYANYYIGLNNGYNMNRYKNELKKHHVPTTLVKQLDDLHIPLNSAFR
ncbi:DUF6305 family protein [Virgibacillus byunsanensis]|uniref:DUF6305 family protein n=1 Tax=Virgibacillus byunsanensis TaxID=570945 RepID=A0ABW3LND6_9BACI